MSDWTFDLVFDTSRGPQDLTSAEDLSAALSQRLGPMLLARARDEQATLPPGLAEEIAVHSAMLQLRSRALVKEAASAIAALNEHGIECVVSKGPGIAAAYRSPAARTFGDIDVLVVPEDFVRSREILSGLGWERDSCVDEQRQYFERRCREAVNLRKGATGSLDLHHHVPPWLWGQRLTVEGLLARANRLLLEDGVELPVVDPVDNFLIACLHIVSDRSRPGQSLHVWRDIIELGRRVDVAEVAERAAPARLLGWVAAVIESIPPEARPFEVPSEWAVAAIPHPRRLRQILQSDDRASDVTRHAARLPSVPNGVAYLAGVIVPSREFLEENVDGSFKHLRWTAKAGRR